MHHAFSLPCKFFQGKDFVFVTVLRHAHACTQLQPLLKCGEKPGHNEPAEHKLEQLLFSLIYFKIRQHNKQASPGHNSWAVLSVVRLILCFLQANSPPLCPPPTPPFSPLTGCHHIFSQLPTTFYSATTDLNTDLASSMPLRRERQRYRTLSLPPRCCRLEFCLSHQSSGCWSTPCYFYTFCLSADQSLDRKGKKKKKHCSGLNKATRICKYSLGSVMAGIRLGRRGRWLSTVIVLGEGLFLCHPFFFWFPFSLYKDYSDFQKRPINCDSAKLQCFSFRVQNDQHQYSVKNFRFLLSALCKNVKVCLES